MRTRRATAPAALASDSRSTRRTVREHGASTSLGELVERAFGRAPGVAPISSQPWASRRGVGAAACRDERAQAAAEPVAGDGRADGPADGERDARWHGAGVRRGSGTTGVSVRARRPSAAQSLERRDARGSGRSSRQPGATLEPTGLEDRRGRPGCSCGRGSRACGLGDGCSAGRCASRRLRTRSIGDGDDGDCRRRPRSLVGDAHRRPRADRPRLRRRCDALGNVRTARRRRATVPDRRVSCRAVPTGRGSVVRSDRSDCPQTVDNRVDRGLVGR